MPVSETGVQTKTTQVGAQALTACLANFCLMENVSEAIGRGSNWGDARALLLQPAPGPTLLLAILFFFLPLLTFPISCSSRPTLQQTNSAAAGRWACSHKACVICTNGVLYTYVYLRSAHPK